MKSIAVFLVFVIGVEFTLGQKLTLIEAQNELRDALRTNIGVYQQQQTQELVATTKGNNECRRLAARGAGGLAKHCVTKMYDGLNNATYTEGGNIINDVMEIMSNVAIHIVASDCFTYIEGYHGDLVKAGCQATADQWAKWFLDIDVARFYANLEKRTTGDRRGQLGSAVKEAREEKCKAKNNELSTASKAALIETGCPKLANIVNDLQGALNESA